MLLDIFLSTKADGDGKWKMKKETEKKVIKLIKLLRKKK